MSNDNTDCYICLTNILNNNNNNSLTNYIYNNYLPKNEIKKQIVASMLASCILTLTMNPLNVIKIKIQNNSIDKLIDNSVDKLIDIQTHRSSISYIIKDVYINSGLKGFWAGSSVSLVQSLPSTVVYMLTYEKFKNEIKHHFSESTIANPAYLPGVAAAFARIFSVSIFAPIEAIKTIKTNGSSESSINIIRNVIRYKGIRSLYSGWLSTILRDTPYSMIYWLTFENIRLNYFPIKPLDNSIIILNTFLSGSIAGCLAALTTHPFDVIKTQQQLSIYTTKNQSNTSMGFINRCKEIYKYYGIFGFYRGLLLRLLTVIPAGGIMITIYEFVKNLDI